MEDERNINFSDEENNERSAETEVEEIQETETVPESEETNTVLDEGSEQEVSEPINDAAEQEETETADESSDEQSEIEKEAEAEASDQDETNAEETAEEETEPVTETIEETVSEEPKAEEETPAKSASGFSKFVKGLLATLGLAGTKEAAASEEPALEAEVKATEEAPVEDSTEATAEETVAEETEIEETTSAEETEIEEATEETTAEEETETEEVTEESEAEEVVEETEETTEEITTEEAEEAETEEVAEEAAPEEEVEEAENEEVTAEEDTTEEESVKSEAEQAEATEAENEQIEDTEAESPVEETVEEAVAEETSEETTEEAPETETTEEIAEDTTEEKVEESPAEESVEETGEETEEEKASAEETTEEVTESEAETAEETVAAEEVQLEETVSEEPKVEEKAESKSESGFSKFVKGLLATLGLAGTKEAAASEEPALEAEVKATEEAPVEDSTEATAEETVAEETEIEETTAAEETELEEATEETTAEEETETEEVTEETTAEEVVEETEENTTDAVVENAETEEEVTEETATEETVEETEKEEVTAEESEIEQTEDAEAETETEQTEDTETETPVEETTEETVTEEVSEEAVEETVTEETTEETAEETTAEETTDTESEEETTEATQEVESEATEEAKIEDSETETTEEVAAEETTEQETTEEISEETTSETTGETTEQETSEGTSEPTAAIAATTAAAAAAPVLSEKAKAKAAKKQARYEKARAKYLKYREKEERKAAKKAAQPIGVKIVKGFFKTIGIILLVVVSLLIAAAAYGAGTVLGVAMTAPEMDVKDVYPTMYPTTVLDAAGNQIAKLTTDGSNRAELTADEITEHVRYAVIDIEDERFYEHKGIDPRGIIRAVKTNLSTDRSEGASTITQQLIKNAVFEGGMEDNLRDQVTRKIREWKLALDLEKKMTKEEILVTYLNTINMGSGVYGIKEAAHFYFNKELHELTVSECAVLAGITQNPSANNPYRHPETNRERQLRVLKKMLEFGHISQDEYDEAVDDVAVYDRIKEVVDAKQGTAVYSYFTDSLLEQVLDDMQEQLGYSEEEAEKKLYAGGLTIYATQNPTVQAIVDEEMNDPANFAYTVTSYSIIWNMSVQKADGAIENYDQNMLSAYHRETLGQTWYKMDYWSTADAEAAINEYKNVVMDEGDTIITESVLYPIQPQVSFSVMDYTNGQVLAVNGGRGEKTANLTLSRATDTFRQPGSTFKPLASFGPAIDMGRASLETPIVDEPFTYPYSGKQVRNWWGESYRGTATVREGIRNSMNVVAVKNLNRIGPENVIPYLQKMGFSTITEQDANLATALGGLTYGVSNLELCAAYAMIANKGVYIEPSFYTTILDYDGNVLLERQPRTEQVFQEYTCTLLIQALQDVVTSGTGTGCAIWTAPVAGKTGTTNDNRDIWFAGFIPNGLCSCIWVGQDDNATLWNANLHQAIYSKTMYRIVEALGLQGGSFPYPSQEIKCICKDTGMLATENCPNTEIRFYDYGWGPGALCTAHPLTGKTEGDEEESTTKKKEESKPKPTQTETTTAPPETETTETEATEPKPPETQPTETQPTETTTKTSGTSSGLSSNNTIPGD